MRSDSGTGGPANGPASRESGNNGTPAFGGGPGPGLLDTILFVDDEGKARKYFRLIFGRAYRVLTAANGEEAFELYLAERERIGIVVTDQIMPRMTGLDLLGKLQALGAPVIRILSTAYVDHELESVAASEGLIDHFIAKPWNIEKLETQLQQSMSLMSCRVPQANP